MMAFTQQHCHHSPLATIKSLSLGECLSMVLLLAIWNGTVFLVTLLRVAEFVHLLYLSEREESSNQTELYSSEDC